MPEYSAGRNLDTGWNITGGAGVQFNRYLGLVGEFMYNELGVTDTTLQSLQFPDGAMRLWALTANPTLHLGGNQRFDLYLVGGGGLYHRTIEFTSPTVQTVAAFDPFLNAFFPVGVAANEVLESRSTLKGGLNIGGGIAVGLSRGAKFYVESRYHHMYTRPNATSILPVTFGVRW